MKHKRQIDQQLQQQRQQQQTARPTFSSVLGTKSPPFVNIEPFNLSSKPPLSPPSKSFIKSDLNYSNDQYQQTSENPKQYYYEKYLINDESNLTNNFNNFTLNDNDDLTEEKPVFSKTY